MIGHAVLFQTGIYNRKKTNKEVILYTEFSRLIEKSERNDTVNQMNICVLLY